MFACRLHAHSLFLGVPLLCVLFLSLPPGTASAAHVLWNYSAAGNWNVGGNWAGGAVPGSVSADSAEIGQGAGNGGTAIIDSVVPNVLRWYLAEQSGEVGTLDIRPGGSLTSTQNNTHYISVRGTGTLNMSGGNLNVAGELRVAGIGSAAPGLVNQSGGRIELTTAGRHLQLAHDTGSQATWNLSGSATELIVADALVLGRNGTGIFRHSDGGTVTTNRLFVNQYGNGNGTYELSGATSLLDIGNVMYVGYQGTGLFQQSGGQVTLPNELSVGEGNGGNGTYELSGGSVAARRLFVGNLNGSTGRFVQTGGTVTTAGSDPDLVLARLAGSQGTYELSGAASQVNVAGTMFVGNWDLGTFTQTEGTVSVNGEIKIGAEPTGDGTYNLGGGSVTTPLFQVGYNGTGEVTQSEGSVTVGTDLYLGTASSGNGTYNLSGPVATSTLDVGNRMYVGNSGTGTFNQSGGTLDVVGHLRLGEQGTGNGTFNQTGGIVNAGFLQMTRNNGGVSQYNLSGATSQLNVSTDAMVGNFGAGTFRQSGGQVTLPNVLSVGESNGGNGIYELSGGAVATRRLFVGNLNGSTGRFVQTGGTVTTAGSDPDLVLARLAGSQGTYELSGAASQVNVAGTMFVGNWDLGTFTQTEGTVSVNEEIRVGAEPTGNGHYNLSGGSVITPLFQVGYDGTGEVTQSGGSVSVGSVLYLGLEASGNGTYRLSGTGTLDVASQLQIGEYGTGVFEMSGGDLTVGSKLFVGLRNTGTGTMTQSGGTVVTPHVNIGYVAGSKGTYQLSGTGTVDVSGQMFVGEYGTADMEVSGGDLSVGSILYLGVRNTGTGTVTQTAGTVTSNEMRIAYTAGSQGTYDLSGPVATSTLDVTGAMYVGYSGTGNFNVDGGKTDVGGDLRVGENSNATGAVVQTGGQVHANRLLLGRVSTANGSYTLSGSASSVTTNGDMWVGHQGDGQFTLDDGALDVGATLFVGYEGTGTFTQNGGSVQAGQLELARSAGKAPADEYVLNSGTLTLDNFARLASWRPGVFTQAGGTVSIGTDLWLTHATATSTADGTYKLQGGELNLTGGQILKGNKPATFEFTGGTLKDVGSIDMTLDQDGGTLAPGATIGTTNILGDYHQAAAGDLQIEINGYGQGTDPGSDYVGVDGNANLDGTLEIVLLDGFMPATGDTFDVVTTTTGSMLLGSTFGLDDSQAGLLPAQYWVATVMPGDKILQLSVGVPEPSTLVLATLGLLGLGLCGWRRRRSTT